VSSLPYWACSFQGSRLPGTIVPSRLHGDTCGYLLLIGSLVQQLWILAAQPLHNHCTAPLKSARACTRSYPCAGASPHTTVEPGRSTPCNSALVLDISRSIFALIQTAFTRSQLPWSSFVSDPDLNPPSKGPAASPSLHVVARSHAQQHSTASHAPRARGSSNRAIMAGSSGSSSSSLLDWHNLPVLDTPAAIGGHRRLVPRTLDLSNVQPSD
jgi:hypothetical protein